MIAFLKPLTRAKMTNVPIIFDTRLVARRRARAEKTSRDIPIAAEAAEGLSERLRAVSRSFGNAVDISSRERDFALLQPLAAQWARANAFSDSTDLALKPESFDLATSVLALHAVNDLPGVLAQIRRALKPDGLFMAALFGGNTLFELREAFASAEAETLGGA